MQDLEAETAGLPIAANDARQDIGLLIWPLAIQVRVETQDYVDGTFFKTLNSSDNKISHPPRHRENPGFHRR